MPRPLRTKATFPMRFSAPAPLSLVVASMLLSSVSSAADCPEPTSITKKSDEESKSKVPKLSTPYPQANIELQMDSFEATREGTWDLTGDVAIKQGDRTLKTRDATYDPNS